jgi:hypothetical protein
MGQALGRRLRARSVSGAVILLWAIAVIGCRHQHEGGMGMGTSDGDAPAVFIKRDGYLVLYGLLQQVWLDTQGRAVARPIELGPIDSFGAARVGDFVILATARDRNRGDDAEPYMDTLVVSAVPINGGPAAELLRLDNQTVQLAGPRIIVTAGGGFTVLWAAGGRLAAQAFDADFHPVGVRELSPRYAGSIEHMAVGVDASGTLALVALVDRESQSLGVLPHLNDNPFPTAIPIASIDDYHTTSVLAAARGLFGAAWTSHAFGGHDRVWFTTLDATGRQSAIHELPVPKLERLVSLVATARGWIVLFTTDYQTDDTARLWSLVLDEQGVPIGPAFPLDRFPPWRLQLSWNGDSWFAIAAPWHCPLETARLSADGRVLDHRHCAIPK